ncbi:MAG TPA: NUDIX domain-containing protein [Actinomycetes bacterium]|nr:NUDIX domain-containing protein [Actinomycetes bacterium]
MAVSSYIARLRRFVGHDLLLIPAVATLIHDDAGNLLLVRQSDNGKWATVGGAIDPGEGPVEAAVREAKEETGLDVGIEQLLGVVGGGKEFEITYPNGDRVAYISTVYTAHVISGEMQTDGDEITEVRWFAAQELATAELNAFARSLLARFDYKLTP